MPRSHSLVDFVTNSLLARMFTFATSVVFTEILKNLQTSVERSHVDDAFGINCDALGTYHVLPARKEECSAFSIRTTTLR